MSTERRRDLAAQLLGLHFDILAGDRSEQDVARELASWVAVFDAPGVASNRTLRLLTADDVEALPPLKWLVEGKLPAETLLTIFGSPSSGKSFLMLDLACCVATGRPWLGANVISRGGVLYVAAEGAAGLAQRLAAWMHAHECTPADLELLRFAIEPVHLLDERACAQLLRALRGLDHPPVLIVFDTLARSLGSGDDVKDMGALIESADRIRRATGAAILFVHHPNAGGERERGHSRLRGDFETVLELKVDEDQRRALYCRKQKDAAEFSPIALDLVPTLNSCVIYRSREGLDGETNDETSLTGKPLECLKAVSEIALERGATSGEWEVAAESHGVSRATYMRARKSLLQQGYVFERKSGNSHRYSLTDSGRHALGLTSQGRSHAGLNGQVSKSHRSPTPLGVGTVRHETETLSDDEYEQQERLALENGS